MTKRERRLIYEGAAVLAANALMWPFVIPQLINSRDTMSFFAAGLFGVGLLTWFAYFVYRTNQETPK